MPFNTAAAAASAQSRAVPFPKIGSAPSQWRGCQFQPTPVAPFPPRVPEPPRSKPHPLLGPSRGPPATHRVLGCKVCLSLHPPLLFLPCPVGFWRRSLPEL